MSHSLPELIGEWNCHLQAALRHGNEDLDRLSQTRCFCVRAIVACSYVTQFTNHEGRRLVYSHCHLSRITAIGPMSRHGGSAHPAGSPWRQDCSPNPSQVTKESEGLHSISSQPQPKQSQHAWQAHKVAGRCVCYPEQLMDYPGSSPFTSSPGHTSTCPEL